MLTTAYWAALAERALKTFAQSLVAVGLVGYTGLLDVDWPAALSAAGLATLLSVLTSIASGAVSGGAGPSLTSAEQVIAPTDGYEGTGRDEHGQRADPDDPEGLDLGDEDDPGEHRV